MQHIIMKQIFLFLRNTTLLFLFLLLVSIVFSLPPKAFAQAYGSGNYGGGNYNAGDASNNSTNTNSSGTSGNGSPPVCGMTPPTQNPQWLYAAVPQDGNAITLYFTDADGSYPYDHYTVTYGTSSGNYSFGLDNAGGKGIRTVLIGSLMPNTTYYFKIRPANGCAAGVWSNEISAKTT